MNRERLRGALPSANRGVGVEDLLVKERREGYPPEYLRSRIRGRRSKLTRDWRAAAREPSAADYLASPRYQGFVRERSGEGLWPALLREHRWVYAQMDRRSRRSFAPYFLYVELRTIFACLRFLEGERREQVAETLEASLLARDLADELRGEDVEEAIRSVEDRFSALSPRFRGLAERYRDKGLREVERELTARYLAWVMDALIPAALRDLFARLIDARNLLALHRSLREGPGDRGMFLEGGTLPTARLADLLEAGDPFSILPLLRTTTGIPVAEPATTRVETALYRGVTAFARKAGRDPLGPGLVLYYLWRCSIEVTNLSLLFAGRYLERDEVLEQLVY